MSKKSASLSDGLIKQNIVLMSGALIAPVIAAANSFEKAAIICMIFSAVTFVTVLLCRLIPRKIVYTVRIIIFALVASVVYMPVFAFLNYYYQLQIDWAGVYIPILVANPLILSKTESRFYLRPVKPMIADVIMYILGFDFACMIIGSIRDLLINGAIGNTVFKMPFDVPALETTFGGYILLGVLAGLCRALYNARKNRRSKTVADPERIVKISGE